MAKKRVKRKKYAVLEGSKVIKTTYKRPKASQFPKAKGKLRVAKIAKL